MRRPFVVLALVLAVALVGWPATAAIGPSPAASDVRGGADPAGVRPSHHGPAPAAPAAPADPPTDVLGWENGYWHNESIAVDQSDGLTDAELEAYVGRSMARVEYLRGREFLSPVPVSVELRSEYRNRTESGESNASFAAWNNQVWEALFIDGEDSDVQEELRATSAASVVGFYAIREDEIKVITETPERPVIDNATMIHELVHALQDQHEDLNASRFRGGTQDRDLAVQGIVEGEANLVEELYLERCGGAWECVETPSQPRGGSGAPPNLGILLTVLQPYSDGPVYVDGLRSGGRWDGVDARLDDPPASTEQVIHSTDEAPEPIAFEDRARNGWQLFPDQGENGSDTVGEASIYVMLWTQSREYDAGVIDWRGILRTEHPYDQFDYRSDASAGWANDRVFPYRRGEGNDTEYGYVWVTRWDTEGDAREFQDAHRKILAAHGAERVGPGTWRIPEGPFADAFHVVREGRTVRITNAPTVADLPALDPRIDVAPETETGPDGPGTATGTGAESGPATRGTAGASEPTDGRTAAPGQPGFGIGVALLAALLAAGFAALRRSRRR